jgi:hypothetical protein
VDALDDEYNCELLPDGVVEVGMVGGCPWGESETTSPAVSFTFNSSLAIAGVEEFAVLVLKLWSWVDGLSRLSRLFLATG